MGDDYLAVAAAAAGCDIKFCRTGVVNANGSVAGELRIGALKWPTIERGMTYTFVRRGVYSLEMSIKIEGRHVKCLRFSESPAISKHLIHDAEDDDFENLSGCIAPGRGADKWGIHGSADAMKDIFAALGGFFVGAKVTILVGNNITGDESKEDWIKRLEREAAKE